MYEEEYQKLLSLFKDSKNVPLETLCGETVKFFESLQEQLEGGTKEEKDHIAKMMNELSGKLMELVKDIYSNTGLDEKEIKAFSEDPANFSPEQWEMMESSKRELQQKAKEFARLLDSTEGGEAPQPPKPRTPKKINRSNRGDWLRS